MKKIEIVFVAVFCINSITFAQDAQELKYFKSDNAFYLGNKRLLDSEIEMTLSSNISALEAWKRGNSFKTANTAMKISTGVLIGVGSGLIIYSLFEASVMAGLWWLFIFDPESAKEMNDRILAFSITGAVLLSAGIASGIMIPVTKASYKSCYSDAANIYNKSKNTVSLHIGVTGNGIGFNLIF